VKKYHPDTPVIFGGLSSSFFHEELIGYDCVDYVLRGDSTEFPATRLLWALKGRGSVDDVPNLTWKAADGSVTDNGLQWVPEDMDAISLDYSYNMRAVIRFQDMMGFVPFRDWLRYPVCAALTCRGCTHDCVTCGGSAYSFREHFGRRKAAFRDPELVVRDIEHIQRYIPGPIFVLNDFLQAGRDYARDFVKGLSAIKLRNPIAFEFFKPPHEEFFEFLDAHLDDYSVEISVESHDDAVRSAFGKKHYTMDQVETSIEAALRHGCKRFDLYFMTGLPTQTAASVRETSEYCAGLYDRLGNDPRLLTFVSPMAPFLDPGSRVFDNAEEYGYTLRARTLEEHRQRLVLPSWKHIMNYESDTMTADELVDATYDAGVGLNRVKARAGIIDAQVARATEQRIAQARAMMDRIDEVMGQPQPQRDLQLAALKVEADVLSESTVCEKSELEWPAILTPRVVGNVLALWVRENAATLFRRGKLPEAVLPHFEMHPVPSEPAFEREA
jgi:B12-binding domain/radical SAM domain protein